MTIRPFRPDDDLAPDLTDAEVEHEARGFWLEEQEEKIEREHEELAAPTYRWV